MPSALEEELVPFAPLRPFPVAVFVSLGPLEASDLESSATVAVRCCRGGAMTGERSVKLELANEVI